MRIVGKGTRDYYDSCMGHGQDEQLCYVRNPESHDIDSDKYKRAISHKAITNKYTTSARWGVETKLTTKNHELWVTSGLVGFCGIVYPFVQVIKKWNQTSCYQPDEVSYFYDEPSLVKYLKSKGWSAKNYTDKKFYYWSQSMTKRVVDKFFEQHVSNDFFFDLGQPVYAVMDVGYTKEFVENPCLNDLQFYKVFDAYTTFQEISMYLGGVLGQAHPPIIEISNEDMAKKKGFGHKYAFRKEPTKKKRK